MKVVSVKSLCLLCILALFAGSCSQTRYSSRSYVKVGQTAKMEERKSPDEAKAEKKESATISSRKSGTELSGLTLKPLEPVAVPVPGETSDKTAAPETKKAKRIKEKAINRILKAQHNAPDQVLDAKDDASVKDGGGLRFVGWLLIILGLILLLFVNIILGIIFLLLGLLFVVVGRN